jgi:hypothetical protein
MTLVRLGERHVGWERDGAVVANVRMQRAGDELTIVALECDDDAAGAELMEAVATVATATRIFGGDDRLAAFGFERADGRWVLDLRAEADDEAAACVTLAELEHAIRSSWDRETTEGPDEWSDDNPAWGNCAVTALVVRDYLGGDLVIAGVVRDGVRVDRHVWNVLPSGLAVDLSRDQFRNGERFEAPQPLDEPSVPGTEERYELLAARVRERLQRRRVAPA